MSFRKMFNDALKKFSADTRQNNDGGQTLL